MSENHGTVIVSWTGESCRQ